MSFGSSIDVWKAIAEAAESSFGDWLRDRKNARRVPHKMEECGYKSVRNPTSKRGRWKVEGKCALASNVAYRSASG